MRRILLAESLNKPRMAVCRVKTRNVKSEWKCLFNCSHKYLAESHSQNKCIGVSLYYCNKNKVDFLLFQRDVAFYLRAKYYVKVYTEDNTNMHYKLSDVVI